MDKSVDQRVQYLDDIDKGWATNTKWADSAIEKLRAGFDVEKESKKLWSVEWRHGWTTFKNSKLKHERRVEWTTEEWRFFEETCGSRSLVTGMPLDQGNVGEATARLQEQQVSLEVSLEE
ncbi:hypothetical protein BGZ75_002028 [Mortierella antarctica]|nr:hypothetical protein BGZ75_002028 [Mortierella antarctica]